MTTTNQSTYADRWRDAINETYPVTDDDWSGLMWDFYVDVLYAKGDRSGGPLKSKNDSRYKDSRVFMLRTLAKAAMCLRCCVLATFTNHELELVRHLMPAHEVHQSGSKRWVLELCETDDERQLVLDLYDQEMTERGAKQ